VKGFTLKFVQMIEKKMGPIKSGSRLSQRFGEMQMDHHGSFGTPPDFVACATLFFKAGSGPGKAADNTFVGNEANICNVQGAIGSADSPFNE